MKPGPQIGPKERLGATITLSLLVHAVLILGVVFTQEDAAPIVPTLDVILTQTQTDQPPKEADFIAQANNSGGGDRDKAQRPREQQISDQLQPDPGLAPRKLTAQAPPPEPQPQERIITSVAGATDVALPREQKPNTTMPLPTGKELTQMDIEMARLMAERAKTRELYAKRPKRKFISASTTENEFATYLNAWVKRVEQVGNANYPIEAERRGISGRLIVTIVIDRTGNVVGMELNEASGHKILDNAVERIIRLSEPFPPLPPTKEKVDELYVTRTWDFVNGDFETSYSEQ